MLHAKSGDVFGEAKLLKLFPDGELMLTMGVVGGTFFFGSI